MEAVTAASAIAEAAASTEWTLAAAVEEFAAISELAEQYGFRVSMFGSVLTKGSGKDLDLLFSPFGSTEQKEVQFLSKFGGVLKDSRLNVGHGVRAFQVERNGRLYDFVFGGFWAPRR
jgi:hypothetical protein